MAVKQLFDKAGGWKTIINYAKAGVLPYMVAQVLLTGKSKTALELMRNGIQLKIKQKLRKHYIEVLRAFDANYSKSKYPMKKSNKVWVCWMQGMEKAPALVQRCYQSLQENLKNKEIVLLTENNLAQYVQIPNFIIEKLHKGIITRTHFSDILRLELLIQHGGTWIDATVFCSGGDIPKYMMEDEFFIFQKIKPGSDGSAINMSSWFMSAWSNQKFLLATRELLYAYWRKNNRMIDYFLLHLFMMIVKDYYKEEWKQIIPYPNSLPHVLQLMQFEQFDQRHWDAVCKVTPFHKLTYKIKEEDTRKKGTFYNVIMNRNGKQRNNSKKL